MPDNEVKPLDLSKMKSTSARIDLSAAAPQPGIRLATPPAAGISSRIEISPVPGVAPKAAPGIQPAEVPEDIYKRRTALLDTSKIPMATGAAPAAPAEPPSAAIPRTVRIGARPTIRIGGAQAPSTFTPGREGEGAAAAPAAKPAIRLKRPGGVTVSASTSASPAALGGGAAGDGFVLNPSEDDEPGTVWAVLALLGLLVTGALIYFQVITMNGAAY